MAAETAPLLQRRDPVMRAGPRQQQLRRRGTATLLRCRALQCSQHPRRHYAHVVCFGEPLLCLVPLHGAAQDGGDVLQQRVTGAELLTACAVARLGEQASVVTVLPDNQVARPVERVAAAAGVVLKALYNAGTEIGCVHLTPSGPVLQGSASAFVTGSTAEAFCWQTLLRDVDMLHVGSSTVDLAPGVRAAWNAAVAQAVDYGVGVSVSIGHFRPLTDDARNQTPGHEWTATVLPLAEQGALRLVTLPARDLDSAADAMNLSADGTVAERVAGLAKSLALLAPNPSDVTVAVHFSREVAKSNLDSVARRWSVVATACQGEQSTVTTEKVAVEFPSSMARMDPEQGWKVGELDGRAPASDADAAWLAGLLSGLLERGDWPRRQHAVGGHEAVRVLSDAGAAARRADMAAAYVSLLSERGGITSLQREDVVEIEARWKNEPAVLDGEVRRLGVTAAGEIVGARGSDAAAAAAAEGRRARVDGGIGDPLGLVGQMHMIPSNVDQILRGLGCEASELSERLACKVPAHDMVNRSVAAGVESRALASWPSRWVWSALAPREWDSPRD